MNTKTCTVDGCTTPTGRHGARGYCSKHYKRWRSTGSADLVKVAPRGLSANERLDWHGWTETPTGCWEFNGTRDKDGYGSFASENRIPVRAHRIAYARTHGPIPDGQVVRHRCDNPPCVNPDHLEAGTYRQNSMDAVERNRSANGERHGMHKITDKEVEQMRSEYDSTGISQRALARKYGCSQSQVSNIVSGRQRSRETGRGMDVAA